MSKKKTAATVTTAEAAATHTVDVNRVARNLVMVRIQKHRWNGHRSAKDISTKEEKAHKTEEGTLAAYRQYLPDDIRKDIARTMAAITRHVDTQTVPWEAGAWKALLTTYLPQFKLELEKRIADANAVRDDFKRRYAEIREEAKKRMNGLWKDEDFPTRDQLDKLYGVEVQYRSVQAPRDVAIEGLEAADVEGIKKQMTDQFGVAIKDALGEVVARMIETLDEVLERLSREDQKSISYGAIRKGVERTHMALTRLNITRDAEVQKLIDKVRDVVQKLDPKTTRTDEAARKTVAVEVKDLRASLVNFGA
jgi:molecular chaperone GrpE (heat shock protein)